MGSRQVGSSWHAGGGISSSGPCVAVPDLALAPDRVDLILIDLQWKGWQQGQQVRLRRGMGWAQVAHQLLELWLAVRCMPEPG